MSKPDKAGGSLEDILSSIRKSLAEQSTDALDEGAAESKPSQRREGLVGRLANATAGLTPAQEAGERDDDLSDVLVAESTPPRTSVPTAPEPPVDPAPVRPAVDPAPASAPSTDKDPLWFLTRSAEPNVAGGSAGVAEPVLTPPEVVRATMPPFFGAAAEAAGVETVPAAPAVTAAPAGRPVFASAASGSFAGTALDREVSLVAAAAETAARPSGSSAFNGAGGGRGDAPAPAGSLQAPHALEGMVLELLKPMLRQWLDQNMPRMVAEALKAEADRAAAAEADAKKP
jgi:uncharacterized protein